LFSQGVKQIGDSSCSSADFCSCDDIFVRQTLNKLYGEEYKPFFAYDFKDSSMTFPDNISDQKKNFNYFLMMGAMQSKCPVPCTTTYVRSSLSHVVPSKGTISPKGVMLTFSKR